jgi:hypothetical protein
MKDGDVRRQDLRRTAARALPPSVTPQELTLVVLKCHAH